MKIWWMRIGVLAVAAACLIIPSACEIPGLEDKEEDVADQARQATQAAGSADGGASVTNLPPPPPSIPAGRKVAGNAADASAETDNFGNEDIWVNGSTSLGVRCLGNDSKSDGLGGDYFIDAIVCGAGALKMIVTDEGPIVAVGADFVSPRSGLVYKFQGFVTRTWSNPLIRTNPYVLPVSEQSGTFRAYWNSHEPAP